MAFQRAVYFASFSLFLVGCSNQTLAPTSDARTDAPPSALASVASAIVPDQSPKDCRLCVAWNQLLTVDKDGAASAALHLCNRGTEPATLDLTVSDFHAIDHHGRSYPLSTVRTLTAVDPANNPMLVGKSPLAANACVDIKIDAAKLWQAGLSVADLQNGPAKLLELKAVRYQVPLNIRVEGQTQDGVNVMFTRGHQSSIRLRNEDELAYQVDWQLELAGETKKGHVFLPGHGLATLDITLPPAHFSLFESGVFRAAAKIGMLTVALAPGPDFSVLPLPLKQYPVAARLTYFSDTSQRITNYVFVLLVLLVGIGLSLLVNQVLPGQKRRVEIKQRLADLEGRLAGFSGVIDSRLLNLLRLEKKLLREKLREQLPIFPQTSLELPQLETRIEWLVQRIELTSSAGQLLEDVEMNQGSLAVPEADEIRMHCREVLDVVRKPTAATDEIQMARKHLQLAEGIRDGAEDEPSTEAVQALRDRAAALATMIPDPLPPDSGWTACEDLLRVLRKDLPHEAAIDRVQYVRKTRVVRRLELIVEFATLVELSAGQDVRTRRLERARELLAALGPGPDASLARAHDLVRQIEQNVTKADLLEEMQKSGTMRVEIDPPQPFAYQLVTFRVRFDRPGLDTAMAQDEIECTWLIDGRPADGRDAPAEAHISDSYGCRMRGWIRGDYFPDAGVKWRHLPKLAWNRLSAAVTRRVADDSTTEGTHTIDAQFPGVPGVTVKGTVTVERKKNYVESRTILAMASLSITVLIVALGLLAGAQEKLQTLDWLSGALAVLALGFGADTLKTLMSKT